MTRAQRTGQHAPPPSRADRQARREERAARLAREAKIRAWVDWAQSEEADVLVDVTSTVLAKIGAVPR